MVISINDWQIRIEGVNQIWYMPQNYFFESKVYSKIYHTGYEAIENVNTSDERRSKIVRKRVFDWHL